MAAKEERSEDLNPRSKDLDEKIRRLLDPSIPDEPVAPKEDKKSATKPVIKEVDGKRPIAVSDTDATETTAPEVSLTPKNNRKVIVPISHDDDTVPAASDETNDPLPAPAAAPEEKPVTKITVDHVEESKEELAEKLDAAIADLTAEPEETEPEDENEEPEGDETPEEELESTTEDEEPATAPPLQNAPKVSEPKQTAKKTTQTVQKKQTVVNDEPPLPEPAVITAKETDDAVKDILTKDSDRLLDVDAPVRPAKAVEKAATKKPKVRIGWLLKFIFWLVVVSVATCMAYPTSRYMALNAAGLRSSSSLHVVDDTTQQPLKNVEVHLGDATAKTDGDGVARFTGLRLGKTVLRIERTAFAPIERTVTIGWGSNPLGDVPLVATGVRYKVQLNDALSGKAVTTAEATIDGVGAHADGNGLVSLTVPQPEGTELTVTISAPNYRTETVKIKTQSKDTLKVSLVPAQRHVYISKRSGKFDLYSVYADGKDDKLLLAGSGNEQDDLVVLPRVGANEVAFASTRAGKRSTNGTLLTDLILVDITSGRTTPITSSERIQLLGWSGSRLVFVSTGADNSTDPKRSRLMSYSIEEGKATEIATSNVFNDLLFARGIVYFAPSSVYPGGTAAQFLRAGSDGSNQRTLLDQEVWDIVRLNYEHAAVAVGQQWYDYELGSTTLKKLDTAPATKTSRVYVDNPSGTKSAWIEQRDGKGTVSVYDTSGKKDTVVYAAAGVTLPVYWLNDDTLVFRVDSGTETADYAVSINGGTPKKVHDVAKTGSLDNWYYY